jgi:hypothetical protein
VVRLIGFACVVPSLWLSVDAQVSQGAAAGVLLLAIASVLLTPVSAIAAAKSFERKAFGTAILCGGAFVALICYNYLNALGAASIARDTMRDTRSVAMQAADAREARHLELSNQIKALTQVSQDETPDMIENDIARLQADPVYSRAKKCQPGFVTQDDSKVLCEKIAIAGKRLAAASRVIEIEQERKRIWGDNTTIVTMAKPSSPDSQSIIWPRSPAYSEPRLTRTQRRSCRPV